MIPLEHIHVVYVIHQEGSFKKASERLFKARSAVSYSVKKVEEYYGIEIFDRNEYRPSLTRDGKLLLQKIQYLMGQVQQFDHFAKQMNSEIETEVRIGVSSIFPMNRLIKLLTVLKSEFPHTVVNLEVETSSGERLLLDDKVDLGIYGSLQQNEQVVYKHIDTFRLPVLVSTKFPADLDLISVSDLARFPQVVLKASYKSGKNIGILENGIQWYVSDHSTKKELIRSGLGWGRIPVHEIEHEISTGQLIQLPCCEEMVVPAYIAKKNDKVLGPVGKKIWDFFSQA
ncbi:LysR family transcriptional regulator [Pseudoalteromonas luteoviolacea]|uniref:LysR family transcriptional regulator n=1 Tax=Pseudoalteromonas luteoviolacea TaxID=43657 RepID=UPI001B36D367|nr:LysR family transcriptional regulator [Pseudoalteromonas luteoviolacea]MBQ4835803.1 LysR family transcriptional regulator [Pseudoalteromonas luteoviolacea]